MFNLFKKKSPTPEKSKPKSIDYLNIESINNDFSKLKCDLVNAIASREQEKPVLLSNEIKQMLLSYYINKIFSLFKDALDNNKDRVYLFGSSLGFSFLTENKAIFDTVLGKHFSVYSRPRTSDLDYLFSEIFDDLSFILDEKGIEHSAGKNKDYIIIKLDVLKKFSNFDKLMVLK